MWKKILTLTMTATLSLTFAASAFASSTITSKDWVKLRSQPSTSGSVYTSLPKGTNVQLLEKVNSYWLKVSYNGQTGYVSTNYFDTVSSGNSGSSNNGGNNSSSSNSGSSVSGDTATVSKSVSFRSAPNTSSTVYSYIKAGTVVKLIEKVNSYWLKIEYNGKVGYASTNYFSNVSGGGSTTPSTPVEQTPSTPEQASATGQRIVDYAKQYLGKVTYKYGVNNPAALTMDCSAFVKMVYKNAAGIDFKWGSNVQEAQTADFSSKSEARIGDLLFFRVNGTGIGHVGIYIGNGQMIHNSTSGGVIISPINSGYWNDRFIVGGRGF